jgi:hypothetical protein
LQEGILRRATERNAAPLDDIEARNVSFTSDFRTSEWKEKQT